MSTKPNPNQHAPQEPHKKPTSDQKPRVKGGSHAKRRKIRFDRIAVVVIPMLLIIILIGALCLHSCNKSGRLNIGESSTESTPVATATNKTVQSTTEDTTDAAAITTESSANVSANAKQITLSEKGVNKGDLIVINNDHSYDFPTGDPKLKSVYEERNSSYSVSDMEVQLDEETIAQLNAMMAAFEEETGFSGMQVFSGYRTKEDQDSRHDSGSTGFRGGYSDYHSGRSFNLKINFGDGTSDYYNAEKYPDYAWISEHAAEYGFIVRYPDGKDSITGEESRSYTFRYVGVPHAVYMTEHKLCLEEYVEKVHGYSADDPLKITVDETTYSVFYVSIGGTNDVDVTIPSENYTASGDNISGYIVTCQ
ncbi:M15 family metallopeptidase [Ruminococcus sp.]|uniref:M15 family metallopeptidase n=1 Tax=Ruminococcus sp. TaxID=41978 RepID=UPI0025FE0C81|nr:M15 family metallopeptidase [Ruminococcus sp.]